jgi:tetratricopeptide (TPR) repeat protein
MTGLYGAAFDCVAARLREHLDRVLRETREASILLEELLLQPRERRRERVRSEPRLWLLKVCEQLEAASRRAWAEEPATAVEMAELAVEVAERLDPRSYGEALVGDARALAWAYLGNARRIFSDFDLAEEALVHAEQLCRQFGADLLTEAEILVFQASLRKTQGRFMEAAGLLDSALRLYREVGDFYQEGRTLILKSVVLGGSGDFEAAIGKAEPRLPLVAHYNLAWYLC